MGEHTKVTVAVDGVRLISCGGCVQWGYKMRRRKPLPNVREIIGGRIPENALRSESFKSWLRFRADLTFLFWCTNMGGVSIGLDV